MQHDHKIKTIQSLSRIQGCLHSLFYHSLFARTTFCGFWRRAREMFWKMISWWTRPSRWNGTWSLQGQHNSQQHVTHYCSYLDPSRIPNSLTFELVDGWRDESKEDRPKTTPVAATATYTQPVTFSASLWKVTDSKAVSDETRRRRWRRLKDGRGWEGGGKAGEVMER